MTSGSAAYNILVIYIQCISGIIAASHSNLIMSWSVKRATPWQCSNQLYCRRIALFTAPYSANCPVVFFKLQSVLCRTSDDSCENALTYLNGTSWYTPLSFLTSVKYICEKKNAEREMGTSTIASWPKIGISGHQRRSTRISYSSTTVGHMHVSTLYF